MKLLTVFFFIALTFKPAAAQNLACYQKVSSGLDCRDCCGTEYNICKGKKATNCASSFKTCENWCAKIVLWTEGCGTMGTGQTCSNPGMICLHSDGVTHGLCQPTTAADGTKFCGCVGVY